MRKMQKENRCQSSSVLTWQEGSWQSSMREAEENIERTMGYTMKIVEEIREEEKIERLYTAQFKPLERRGL